MSYSQHGSDPQVRKTLSQLSAEMKEMREMFVNLEKTVQDYKKWKVANGEPSITEQIRKGPHVKTGKSSGATESETIPVVRQSRFPFKCWSCEQVGHIRADCPLNRSRPTSVDRR